MKTLFKLSFIWLLATLSFPLIAQPLPFQLSGTVFSGSNPATPAANQPVVIFAVQNNQTVYSNTVVTNNQGQYQAAIPGGGQIGPNMVITAWVYDYCISDTIIQTVSNMQGTVTSAVLDFYTCPQGSLNCSASLSYSPVGGMNNTYNFQGFATGVAPFTYQWYFGNGATSNVFNPNYTFPGLGNYTVCLTITDAGGCVDSTCTVITIGSNPNCNAVFTSFPLSNAVGTYQFIAAYNSPTAVYQWEINNQIINIQQPSFQWQFLPGTYTICLNLNDSLQNCTQSTCTTIVIPPVGGNCLSGFSYTVNPANPLNYQFTFTGQAQNTTSFSYSFGTGQGSALVDPSYTFPSPGTYTVCLEILDSLNQCYDVYCTSILVAGNSACFANFQAFPANAIPFGMSFQFTGQATNTAQILWDLGDGTTASGLQVFHVYNQNGVYNVCVTIIDSNLSCNQTFCGSVLVDPFPLSNYSLGGSVFYGNLPNLAVNDATAFLYRLDSLGLIGAGQTAVTNSNYLFQGLPVGIYIVRVGLNNTNPYTQDYISTYHFSESTWTAADLVILTADQLNVNVNLIPSVILQAGTGNIQGTVTLGSPKTGSADPLAGITLLLWDDQMNVLQAQTSDAVGFYRFSNLPDGTYRITAEEAGFNSEQYQMTLNSETTAFDIADFERLENNYIALNKSTSIAATEGISPIRLYPNPASDKARIEWNATLAATHLSVTDALGRKILAQDLTGNHHNLNMETWNQGLYILEILRKDGSRQILRLLKN